MNIKFIFIANMGTEAFSYESFEMEKMRLKIRIKMGFRTKKHRVL